MVAKSSIRYKVPIHPYRWQSKVPRQVQLRQLAPQITQRLTPRLHRQLNHTHAVKIQHLPLHRPHHVKPQLHKQSPQEGRCTTMPMHNPTRARSTMLAIIARSVVLTHSMMILIVMVIVTMILMMSGVWSMMKTTFPPTPIPFVRPRSLLTHPLHPIPIPKLNLLLPSQDGPGSRHTTTPCRWMVLIPTTISIHPSPQHPLTPLIIIMVMVMIIVIVIAINTIPMSSPPQSQL